ncbi:hypothetical protein RHODGE_RHODGE_02087 [Rhodoplanes serenus]|uniref:CorA-like Mg2+ transporter protein n=1 Tax=Rhodoplanes serenus TaxID=200615 RepID=A0A3S5CY93_9BRAD|nr:hypothetical protein [Rhodoplanes serenus]VCU08228.1 hypothetical protein RHODGE_RHODGE_02087 [Rhodoplanes serenus]
MTTDVPTDTSTGVSSDTPSDGAGPAPNRPAAAPSRPAGGIPVREARFILLWPLTLHLSGRNCEARAMADAVRDVAEALRRREQKQTTRWRHQPDPLHHIPMPSKAEEVAAWKNAAYAETVYFHEFVQSFLFRKQADGRDAPFHLFQRDDLRFAEVTIGTKNGATDKRLTVERLNLYLFRTGVAILVLELWAPSGADGTSGWTLAQVQDFHELVRRVYVPYRPAVPEAEVPVRLAIEFRHDAELDSSSQIVGATPGAGNSCSSQAEVEALVQHPDADGRRRPPILPHWKCLLDNALAIDGDPGEGTGRWHQVVDERMPTIATISLTSGHDSPNAEDKFRTCDITKIVQESDLIRLCFADGSGSGEQDYPYDREFLGDMLWTKHAYARFRSMGTLFLISGTAFVAVGSGSHFNMYVMNYVRRHYFQMGLLLHFEQATLLAFSSQISRAVECHGLQRAHGNLQDALSGIEEQFLHFVHRFRFTGVSNQIQGREIFDLWRDRLDLARMFDDLRSEIHTANEFLSTQAQTRTSLEAVKLSQVATIGVVFGLAFSALGMNVVFNPETLRAIFEGEAAPVELSKQLAIAAATIGVLSVLGGALIRAFDFDRRGTKNVPSIGRVLLWFGFMALCAAAFAYPAPIKALFSY